MITPAYVRTMAAYNSEMNRRLYGAASRLSDVERRRDRGAFWGSLHATLVHILWGDGQWMSRFDGWQRPTTPIKESGHMLVDYSELCAERIESATRSPTWPGSSHPMLGRNFEPTGVTPVTLLPASAWLISGATRWE